MNIFLNTRSAILKYIETFKIAKIKKKNYIFVIFLTIVTVSLDALGISILLPIGEYVLNYDSGKIQTPILGKFLKRYF